MYHPLTNIFGAHDFFAPLYEDETEIVSIVGLIIPTKHKIISAE